MNIGSNIMDGLTSGRYYRALSGYIWRLVISVVVFSCVSVLPVEQGFGRDSEENAQAVVQRAFDYWRGLSSTSLFSMTIHRSDFDREMVMRGWTKGRDVALFSWKHRLKTTETEV